MPRAVVDGEFFAEQGAWNNLADTFLRPASGRQGGARVWSAGCSTGKEAYSLAMLLHELAPAGAHYILATDRDPDLLEKAHAGGPFTAADVRNLTPRQRAEHLDQRGDRFFVKPTLARQVTFRRHDLLTDPFESGFDLIVCQNVATLFSDESNRALCEMFAHALVDEGILFIGALDSLPPAGMRRFRQVRKQLYERV